MGCLSSYLFILFVQIDKTDPKLNITVNQELLQVGSLILQLGKSDVGSGVANVDIYNLGGTHNVVPLTCIDIIIPL